MDGAWGTCRGTIGRATVAGSGRLDTIMAGEMGGAERTRVGGW